ncbi:MAG: hypothetical protein A3F74_25960 [Betaproteobacteria bacterium RIFCSPLOWO2_12_FULL_62_58]|nr:MAG: hypothetical protein A3F74_25960 [Betaproteobacteria bacterium RIFCSPLOWO2_12_FULL_62_58]
MGQQREKHGRVRGNPPPALTVLKREPVVAKSVPAGCQLTKTMRIIGIEIFSASKISHGLAQPAGFTLRDTAQHQRWYTVGVLLEQGRQHLDGLVVQRLVTELAGTPENIAFDGCLTTAYQIF